MIARLRGTLIERGEETVVVDAGGVGYRVRVSAQALAALPAEGETVDLRVHTHVTESAIDLFGFCDRTEQRAFELLIKVQNVGPRTAVQILSAAPAAELARSIAGGDKGRLRAIPGIGPKTAERLILELREPFGEIAQGATAPAAGAAAAPRGGDGAPSEVQAEAARILAGLGMKAAQAQDLVRRVPDGPIEQVVAEALRLSGGGA